MNEADKDNFTAFLAHCLATIQSNLFQSLWQQPLDAPNEPVTNAVLTMTND